MADIISLLRSQTTEVTLVIRRRKIASPVGFAMIKGVIYKSEDSIRLINHLFNLDDTVGGRLKGNYEK